MFGRPSCITPPESPLQYHQHVLALHAWCGHVDVVAVAGAGAGGALGMQAGLLRRKEAPKPVGDLVLTIDDSGTIVDGTAPYTMGGTVFKRHDATC